jgi:hypothetical protein
MTQSRRRSETLTPRHSQMRSRRRSGTR